jgi:hypothetical protein
MSRRVLWASAIVALTIWDASWVNRHPLGAIGFVLYYPVCLAAGAIALGALVAAILLRLGGDDADADAAFRWFGAAWAVLVGFPAVLHVVNPEHLLVMALNTSDRAAVSAFEATLQPWLLGLLMGVAFSLTGLAVARVALLLEGPPKLRFDARGRPLFDALGRPLPTMPPASTKPASVSGCASAPPARRAAGRHGR